jgi:hypothetical protein
VPNGRSEEIVDGNWKQWLKDPSLVPGRNVFRGTRQELFELLSSQRGNLTFQRSLPSADATPEAILSGCYGVGREHERRQLRNIDDYLNL